MTWQRAKYEPRTSVEEAESRLRAMEKDPCVPTWVRDLITDNREKREVVDVACWLGALVREYDEVAGTDARALRQILLNLLSNAVKFTPEGGKVRLDAFLSDQGDLIFEVHDTGIGMADAEIKTALTPFGQVDSRLSRRFEGTGLGLPLSKGLTELHGGTLTVQSESGKGTTVVVILPAQRVCK